MTRHTTAQHPHLLRTLRVVQLLIVCASVSLGFAPVSAAEGSVGVSPATASFIDPPLLAGGSMQVDLQFQQQYKQPVAVHVAAIPLESGTADAHTWLDLDRSGNLTLAQGTHRFRVDIEVPESTANGLYKAGVSFRTTPPEPTEQEGSSATTESSVTATILIQVNNENQVKQIKVSGAPTIGPTEEEVPLRVSVPLTNTGNVDVVPVAKIEIKDKLQSETVASFTVPGATIRPGQVVDQPFVITEHGLRQGQYWMVVTTLLDDEIVDVSKAQSFDILQPGELARVAELRSIRIDGDLSRASVGQMVKLTAVVVNTGDGPLSASFEGEVIRNGIIVDALQSRPVEIATGESGNLTMLYQVEEAGKYEFKGRVFYGAKVTEEKSVLLAVDAEPKGVPSASFGMLGLVGALAAVVFLARRQRHQDE